MNAALKPSKILSIPHTTLPGWAAPLRDGCTLVLDDLPNAVYHGTYSLVSKSALDVFGAKTPAHYEHMLLTGLEPEEDNRSESQRQADEKDRRIGSAFHSLVLEPHNFHRDFVELPDFGNMQSSKNRELRDAWIANEGAGRTTMKPEWVTLARAMRESLYRHKRIRRILEKGRPEVTCAAVCPITGLPLKCRFDWVSELDAVALDLKSARDASRKEWKREAGKRRYFVQDPYYCNVAQLCDLDVQVMGFAVCEKTGPMLPALYLISDTGRLAGETTYMEELARLAECVQTGHFPGYGEDAIELELSPWDVAAAATVT